MPMVPPAPPTFSTTTCCPSVRLMESATRRATVSVGPPAAAGTTIVTGLSGYDCAAAAMAPATDSTAPAARPSRLRAPFMRFLPAMLQRRVRTRRLLQSVLLRHSTFYADTPAFAPRRMAAARCPHGTTNGHRNRREILLRRGILADAADRV